MAWIWHVKFNEAVTYVMPRRGSEAPGTWNSASGSEMKFACSPFSPHPSIPSHRMPSGCWCNVRSWARTGEQGNYCPGMVLQGRRCQPPNLYSLTADKIFIETLCWKILLQSSNRLSPHPQLFPSSLEPLNDSLLMDLWFSDMHRRRLHYLFVYFQNLCKFKQCLDMASVSTQH